MSNKMKSTLAAIKSNFEAIAKRQRALAAKVSHPRMKAMREKVAKSYEADLPKLTAFVVNCATDAHESLAEYVCDEGHLTWTDERGNTTSIYAVTDSNGWLAKGIWFLNSEGLVRERVGNKRLVKVENVPSL